MKIVLTVVLAAIFLAAVWSGYRRGLILSAAQLAAIVVALYGAALKFELLAAFLVMMVMPCFGNGWVHAAALFAGVGLVSVAVGVIESVMARMRFLKSPQSLMGAALIASLAVLVFVCF